MNRFLSNGRYLNVRERQDVYTGIAYFYRITEIQITGKYLKLLHNCVKKENKDYRPMAHKNIFN